MICLVCTVFCLALEVGVLVSILWQDWDHKIKTKTFIISEPD